MSIEYCYTDFDKNYKKLSLLGNGSYGKVYEVINIKTGEKYAVKQVPCDYSQEISSSIYNEIVILQKLNNHKNIIKLLKICFSNYSIYYFFPIYKYTLATYFSEKRISVEDENKIKVNLCNGLYALHSNGFAHYDIKPQNIMLNNCDDVVFIDFGLNVILVGSKHDVIKCEKQTITYRAPEVFYYYKQDIQYGFKADIWSLGIIFYELFILASTKPCISYTTTIINPMDESKTIEYADKKMRFNAKKTGVFSENYIENKYHKIYGSKQLLRAYSISYKSIEEEYGNFLKYFPDCPNIIADMLALKYWERPTVAKIIKCITGEKPVYDCGDKCRKTYDDKNWIDEIYRNCLDNIYTYGRMCKFKEIVAQNAFELLYVVSVSNIIPPQTRDDSSILSIVCLLMSVKLYDCRHITADLLLETINYKPFQDKVIEKERKLLILLDFNIYHTSPFNYLLQQYEKEFCEEHPKILFSWYYFRLRTNFTAKEIVEKCLNKEFTNYVEKLPDKYY